MAFNRLRSHIQDWQEMAAVDPLRAISGLRKQWNLAEFFTTAQPHMDQLFSAASSLGLPKTPGRALEFGCGAGRFLRYFEAHFKEVWGVDVSEEMLKLASQHNPRCKFHLITAMDLGFFPDDHFDLVYSFLVLQHLPAESMIASYLKEFIRVLRPGGVAAFQIPNRLGVRWTIQPRRRAYHLLRTLGFQPKVLQSRNLLPMSLIAMSGNTVAAIVSGAGGRMCREETLGGNEGIMYYCTK